MNNGILIEKYNKTSMFWQDLKRNKEFLNYW
jgi:hypothetical protein